MMSFPLRLLFPPSTPAAAAATSQGGREEEEEEGCTKWTLPCSTSSLSSRGLSLTQAGWLLTTPAALRYRIRETEGLGSTLKPSWLGRRLSPGSNSDSSSSNNNSSTGSDSSSSSS